MIRLNNEVNRSTRNYDERNLISVIIGKNMRNMLYLIFPALSI